MTDFKWCEVCEDHVQPEEGVCQNCEQIIDLVAFQDAEDFSYLVEAHRDWADSMAFRAAPYHGWPL